MTKLNKSQFQQKVKGVKVQIDTSTKIRCRHITQHQRSAWDLPPQRPVEYFEICPAPGAIDKYTPQRVFSWITIPIIGKSAWTKTNYNRIFPAIADYIALWRREAAAWRKSHQKKIRDSRRKAKIRQAAAEAGVYSGQFGSDEHQVYVGHMVWGAAAKKLLAAGDFLAIVDEERTRTYAKSSDWRPSTRTDTFLVGRNENGNAFAHQIPNNIGSVVDALRWIWRDNDLEARQGDIGLTRSTLKHIRGRETDIDVMGHSRHRFIGEVYQNGSTHVRSGFLYHTADQHPPVYVDGSRWRRIVIARRSQIGLSSAD